MAQQADHPDSDSELLPIKINRRNLLLTTGVGVASSGIFSSLVAAQSNDNPIWESDFDSASPGDVPSNFVLAGNNDQQVTDSIAREGSQSYEMNGSYGGCWEALMRRELFNGDSRPDAMRIEGSFRLGDGEEGCHSNSAIGWRTVASSSWSQGSGTQLLNFKTNGEISSAGETVGEYEQYEWVDFTVDYEWDQENEEITHTCTIDDGETTTVTRDQRDDEASLTALGLQSGDFTVHWDNLKVNAIEPEFDLRIISTNEPIASGEQLSVDIEVENTGGTTGTRNIELESIPGDVVDETTMTLTSGSSMTATLTWDTNTGSIGGGPVTVRTADTEVTETVTIEEQGSPNITLSLTAPTQVDPETSFTISGTVENTGDAAAEGSTILSVDNEIIDSVDTILAGEATTLSGSVESGATDDTHDITLTAPNNASESTTVTVTEPDTAQLDISLDVPDTVDPNTTFDVSGTVENTGEAEAPGGATLSVDNETIDSTEVIAAGEDVTLSSSVEAGEGGSSHTVMIESPDGGSETQTVSVEATEEATCTGSPTMSRTSITSPQETITSDSPAQVEANFRVDPNVPQECEVIVNLEYSFSQSGFQFSGGSGWDQSASDIVATEFDGLQSGEIRSISADIEANGADPGDDVTVVATYEVWYAGNRDDSLQQTTRETITVEGSSGGSEQGDDGSTDGTEQGDDGSTDGTEQDEDSGTTDGDGSSVNVDVPGFGIPSTLTAVGSAGYMIKRRLSEDKEKE